MLDLAPPVRGRGRTLVFYGLMVLVAIGAFLAIRGWGETLRAPQGSGEFTVARLASRQNINSLLHVLLALAAIIIVTRLAGSLFRYLQQPPVIGEVIGGILLGPSLLGKFFPAASQYVLPSNVAPFLSVIAQLGVILYMFLVGLELDLRVVRRSGHAALAISHASIILPFLLGAVLSLKIYPIMSSRDVPFTVFALFLGVSLSVTAFPVLARILTDSQLSRTAMGSLALTCAAVDDVSAWCLLALVVSVTQNDLSGAIWTLLLTLGFILLMLGLVKPLLRRLMPLLQRSQGFGQNGLAILCVAMLLSALATEYIGIHAIFGAFLLGAVIPSNSRVVREMTRRLEDIVSVLFLPAFFAFTGMRTRIDLISGFGNWQLCGLIILVACLGKFGGTYIASRLVGLARRDSAGLGILMNTRGLVELIALNIGLDLKVISPLLFTMLVLMALATTFMTTPILRLVLAHHSWTTARVSPLPASE